MGRDTTWDHIGSGYTQAVGFKNAEQGLLDNINKHVTPLIDSIFKDKRSLEEKNYATQVQQNTTRLQADLVSGLVKESDLAGMNLANINGKDLSKTLNDLSVNDEKAMQNQRMYELAMAEKEAKLAQYKNVNDARTQQYKVINDKNAQDKKEKTTAATLKRDEIELRKRVTANANKLYGDLGGDAGLISDQIGALRVSGNAEDTALATELEGMYNQKAELSQAIEVRDYNRITEDLGSTDFNTKKEGEVAAKRKGIEPRKALTVKQMDNYEKDLKATYPELNLGWFDSMLKGTTNDPISKEIALNETIGLVDGVKDKKAIYKRRIVELFDRLLADAQTTSALEAIEDKKAKFLHDIEKGTRAAAVKKKSRDAKRKNVTLP